MPPRGCGFAGRSAAWSQSPGIRPIASPPDLAGQTLSQLTDA